MILVCTVSVAADLTVEQLRYWFQRSGALVVIAAMQLQYSKLVSLWKQAIATEQQIDPVVARLERDERISMKSAHDESAATRNFAVRLHGLLTQRDIRDVWATVFLIVGTLIWSYGDLPFAIDWSVR